MLAIKTTAMNKMPESCDECIWFETRPHPHRGWTDICQLEAHCLDDDQPKEWIYSGDGRVKACPLIEINAQPERKKGHWKMELDPYGFFDKIPVCSECGCTTEMRKIYKFCPNCGADMRGKE